MIKFIGRIGKGNGLVLGLGLSHENLDSLKGGKPIDIDLADMMTEYYKDHTPLPGVVTNIMIFAGETEQTMAKDMAALIGPKTVVVDKIQFRPDPDQS